MIFHRLRQLQNVDSVLQRTTIIGVILCFRSLAQEALQDVLDKRIPFLMTSVKDFQQHMPKTQDSAIANIRSQVRRTILSVVFVAFFGPFLRILTILSTFL